eukprot:4713262-Pyramimonas_sp.AAC.1
MRRWGAARQALEVQIAEAAEIRAPMADGPLTLAQRTRAPSLRNHGASRPKVSTLRVDAHAERTRPTR